MNGGVTTLQLGIDPISPTNFGEAYVSRKYRIDGMMQFLRTKLPLIARPTLRRNVVADCRSRDVFIPELATSFPYRWLRDSCQCSDCVHPSTLQKLHRTSDIPDDLCPVESELTSRDLCITWHTNPQHKSVYPLNWLKNYTSAGNTKAFHMDLAESTWDLAKLQNTPHLFVDYAKLHNDTSLLHALTQLIKYGLIFVRGVPNDVTDDRNCELRRLASTFGRIRETFYGEVWNVQNIRNSTNIAYTSLDLDLHMDLL
jgi:gamma-butyrobetaine dioxygenase